MRRLGAGRAAGLAEQQAYSTVPPPTVPSHARTGSCRTEAQTLKIVAMMQAPQLAAQPVGNVLPGGSLGAATMPPPQQAAQGKPGDGPPGVPSKKPRRRVLTSLLLEIFLFFGGWWDVFFYVLNILIFAWKGAWEGATRPALAPVSPPCARTGVATGQRSGGRAAASPGTCQGPPSPPHQGPPGSLARAHRCPQASTCPTPTATLPWSGASPGSGSSSRCRGSTWVSARNRETRRDWRRSSLRPTAGGVNAKHGRAGLRVPRCCAVGHPRQHRGERALSKRSHVVACAAQQTHSA